MNTESQKDCAETDVPSIRVGTEGQEIKVGDRILYRGREGIVRRTFNLRCAYFSGVDGPKVEFEIAGRITRTDPAMDPEWGGKVN